MSRVFNNGSQYNIYLMKGDSTTASDYQGKSITAIIPTGQTYTRGDFASVLLVPSNYPNNKIKINDTQWNIDTNTITVKYYDAETGDYNDVNVRLITDNFFGDSNTSEVTIADNALPATTTIKIINNVSTATCNYTSLDVGNTYAVIFTANNGLKFDSATLQYTNKTTNTTVNIDGTYSDDHKKITYDVTTDSHMGDLTFTGTTSAYVEPINIPITNSISNSTVSKTSITSYDEQTITITANSGYKFMTDVVIKYYNKTAGDYENIAYTKTSDTVIAFTIKPDANMQSIHITGSTEKSEAVTVLLDGINSIVFPTDKELSEIGSKRFYNVDGQQYDYGVYIASLKKIYVKKENINIKGKTQIVLGSQKFDVYCDVTDSYYVTLNLGTKTIFGHSFNAYDFDADIKIYLPFIGMEELDTNLVMNKGIKVTYTINLVDGMCLAQIYANNKLIYTFSGSISYEVPYKMNDNLFQNTSFKYDSSDYLGDKQAFILYTYDSYNRKVKISKISGFTKFENVELTNGIINYEDANEIVNLLESGVFL